MTLVNGLLLLCTVLTQPFVPWLLRRFGWGPTLAASMVLLGVPALAHSSPDSLASILALSAVRGVGFGIITVSGNAATAELVEPARKGAAIGVYGPAIAGPQVLLLPAGPVVAEQVGFGPAFVLGAAPLLGILPAFALGRHIRSHDPGGHASGADHGGDTPPSRTSEAAIRLLRPMNLLLGVTLAGGSVITFAPQMIDDATAVAAALALMGLTAAISRWQMGGLADRYGARRFIAPLVLVTITSMVLAALAVREGNGLLFLVAVTLLGVSYGGLQNLRLVMAFDVVRRPQYGLASAVWNIGFDLGMALGSVLVGWVAVRADFPAGLLVAAAIALLTLPLAIRRPAQPR